jgi:hypothetical protein
LPVLIESRGFNEDLVDITASIRESFVLSKLHTEHQLDFTICCHILLITNEITTLYANRRDVTEHDQTVITTTHGHDSPVTVRVLRTGRLLLIIACHHLSLVCGITTHTDKNLSASWSSRMLPSVSIANHHHKCVCTRASSPWVSRGQPPHPESKAMVTRYPIRDTGYIVCSILAFGEHLRCDGHLGTMPLYIQRRRDNDHHTFGIVTDPCPAAFLTAGSSHARLKSCTRIFIQAGSRVPGVGISFYPLPKEKGG